MTRVTLTISIVEMIAIFTSFVLYWVLFVLDRGVLRIPIYNSNGATSLLRQELRWTVKCAHLTGGRAPTLYAASISEMCSSTGSPPYTQFLESTAIIGTLHLVLALSATDQLTAWQQACGVLAACSLTLMGVFPHQALVAVLSRGQYAQLYARFVEADVNVTEAQWQILKADDVAVKNPSRALHGLFAVLTLGLNLLAIGTALFARDWSPKGVVGLFVTAIVMFALFLVLSTWRRRTAEKCRDGFAFWKSTVVIGVESLAFTSAMLTLPVFVAANSSA